MSGTKLLAALAALALGCLAGLVLADNAEGNKNKNNNENKTLSDREFVQKASADNLAEIDMGMLAMRKGATAGVRDFGKVLVHDHTQLNKQLNKVADKLGIVPARTANAKQQTLFNKLLTLNGAAFDKSFIHHEVPDHEKAIKTFEHFSKNGKNASLREAAKESLPLLRKHLKIAEGLQKKNKEGAAR